MPAIVHRKVILLSLGFAFACSAPDSSGTGAPDSGPEGPAPVTDAGPEVGTSDTGDGPSGPGQQGGACSADKRCADDSDCFIDEICDDALERCQADVRCDPRGDHRYELVGRSSGSGTAEVTEGSGPRPWKIELSKARDGGVWNGECERREGRILECRPTEEGTGERCGFDRDCTELTCEIL
jgi:hypothetical protein